MGLPNERLGTGFAATGTAARVLVIDDDPELGQALQIGLRAVGFVVSWVATGAQGSNQVAQWHPDVVILDLVLPDGDGIMLCKHIRSWANVPIIVLSVRDQDQDKIAAFEQGADDYLTKPFSANELIARVRVALRHAAQRAGSQGTAMRIHIGDLNLDFERRSVSVNGQDVHLSPTEYALLIYLIQHPNKVLTHRRLLQAVWGPSFGDALPALRVTVAQLRRKIEADPGHPRYIVTELGIGYRFDKPEDDDDIL